MKPTDAFHDPESLSRACRDLVQAVERLARPAYGQNTLAARNVMYHEQELYRWIDAFYGTVDLDENGEPPPYDN